MDQQVECQHPLAIARGSVPRRISVARFTGSNRFSRLLPSTKVLGYFQNVR